MTVLHLVQGIAMLLLCSDFALPVTSAFSQLDTDLQQLVAVPNTLGTLQIGPLVAAFLFLSALAHAVVASPGINRWYVNNLRKGINYTRWVEYSLSASLMTVIIGMLVGLYDFTALIMLFALNTAMILFGWMMELHNQSTAKVNWTSFWMGSIIGLVPWIAIFAYLIGAGNEAGGPPGFVYGIFVSIFIFFNVFAINMVLQYKKVGPWRDYVFGERAYIVLSLTAKSALAWQVFAGTLRPV
jgi:hypothetical protein